ncbi:hypothetical protein CCAX7_53280 [Capsulimonas corticalis]|uniref:Uncharacterized protein n=1 Tax=Capsulimonas corticalis TaxID=2219043 RepID=A0A402CNP3_9BACT|nr:hypothetical protein [Capsulimonas corticalis]BDI33277.1 hypothetical protein CCAX7_53280 [Capsulimonas corticalis]
MPALGAQAFINTGVFLGLTFAARVWSKWRVDRRKQAALRTPLVDGAVLEAALTPRPADGDDADLLAELRETFALLNRQAYAEEFWGLHQQLETLDATLGAPQRATLRRALLRLLASSDRWLQLVSAKACADLQVAEAAAPIQLLLGAEGEPSKSDGVGDRYRTVLEEALVKLGSDPLSLEK